MSRIVLESVPEDTAKEREHKIARLKGAVFIMQIGCRLKSGNKHDGRAPDYDDWSLNGDIMVYHKTLDIALEISSMGIRVDAEALDRQLRISGHDDRRELPFHKMLLAGELPYTIGGGIGQSRLCMLLLGKAHIGEVQSSIWDAETLRLCREAGISEFGDWLDFETLTCCHFDTSAVIPELLGPEALDWLNEYNDWVYRTLAPLLPSETASWLREKTMPI